MTGPIQVTVNTIILGLPKGQRIYRTSIALPLATVTPRDLILTKINQEVMECGARERARLSGEHLSHEALIRAEESDSLLPGPAAEACARALNAFIAGDYMIVINDQRIRDLETPITLDPDSRIEFIKILPLVGG